MSEESASGSSSLLASSSRVPKDGAGISNVWWSLPRKRATTSAYLDSSWLVPGNATVKVLMHVPDTRWAAAATKLESSPPDKNTPTGTSLRSRKRTASSNNSPARSVSDSPSASFVAVFLGRLQYRQVVSLSLLTSRY